jgi:isocitrate dehydrogenase (NAD+)
VQPTAEKMIPATLIPGDGIGPEIVESTVKVLEALGASFRWEVHKAGMAGVNEFGDPLPQPTLDSIRRTRLALKGPLTTPVGGGYRSSNVRLRDRWGRFASAALRP